MQLSVLFWQQSTVSLVSVTSFQAYPRSVVSFCSFVPSVAGSTPAGVCVLVCVSAQPVFPSIREIITCFHPDFYSAHFGECPVKWRRTGSHSA